MPTYERWKYCGICGEVADYECTDGMCYHPEKVKGMANPPPKEKIADHPRFICDPCLEELEKKRYA